MDGNADQSDQVGVWFTPSLRRFSLVTTGFPREYVVRGQQVGSIYQLRSINRENPNQDLDYSITPTTGNIGGSFLRVATPGVWGTAAPSSVLSLSNNVINWIPNIVIGNSGNGNICRREYCPYAFSVTVSDYFYPYNADGTPNDARARADVGIRRIATQIDYLFIVIRPCDPNSNNCPPTWADRTDRFYTIATVPNSVDLLLQDNSSPTVVLENTPPPSDLTLTSKTTVKGNTSSIAVNLVHDPDIDGAASALICLTGSNGNGLSAIGSFCPTFILIRPNFMFVTGILREWSAGTSDNRIDATQYPWPGSTQPSTTVSSATRRPTLTATSTNQVDSAAFDSWWSDLAPSNLVTISMVSYYNPALDNTIVPTAAQVIQAQTEPWMDPRRRMFSFRRPYWLPSVSKFYTYEVHTTFDLLTSEVDAATSLKFGVSGGELFVYINSVLVTSLSKATQVTPTVNSLIDTSITQQLTYSTIRNIIDPFFPAGQIPPRNKGPETYDLDIFYTHRTASSTTPSQSSGFHMEFGSSTQCSAITVLRSQQWKAIADLSIIFDYTNGPLSGRKSAWDPTTLFFSNPQTSIAPNGSLLLLPQNYLGSAASVFYKNSLLKILNGFESTFSFTASGTSSPGFAFVLQTQSPSARGSEGSGLGYAGITNAIAIEFDMYADDIDQNFKYQHISCHRSTIANPRISASETADSWPVGSSPVGNLPGLPFDFRNNSRHDIKIEFSPQNTAYWVYVYVNKNIKPLFTAQFPRKELDTIFKDGAYIGFTTSNYGSTAQAGALSITDFGITVIPPLASQSGFASGEPKVYSVTAGETFSAKVQLRDACGSNLLVKGEENHFIAALVNRDSDKPATGNPLDAVDIPPVTIRDEDNGIYSVSAPVTRSGSYQLYIYYQEVGLKDGEGQPLGTSAQDYSPAIYGGTKKPLFNKGVNEKFTDVTVAPSSPDPSTSLYAYPTILPGLDNAIPTTGTVAAGLSCARFSPDFTTMSPFTLISTPAAYTSAFPQASDANSFVLVCVLRGGVDQNTSNVVGQAMTSLGSTGVTSTNDPTTQIPPSSAYSVANLPTFSAAWIHAATLADSRLSWSSIEHVSTTFSFGADPAIRDLYVESWSPRRINQATIGQGMVLARPVELVAATNGIGSFYMYSKDRFGNAVNNVLDISFSFTPSLQVNDPVNIVGTPFTQLPFATKQSGRFSFQSFFFGNPSQIGRSGSLVVTAGRAHYSTSIQSGISVSGAVDTPLSFFLTLRDISGNAIITQTALSSDNVYMQWISTESAAIASSCEFTASTLHAAATPGFSMIVPVPPAETTPPGFAQGSFTSERYSLSYTPTFAGTYYVKVFINPDIDPSVNSDKYNPTYEMTDSKGKIVSIAAGPTAVQSLVEQLDHTGSPVAISTSYQAGEVYMFLVQTRDKYGNNRFGEYDDKKQVRLFLSIGGTDLTQDLFNDQVDLNLSSGIVANYFTGSSAGSGSYRFSIVLKKTTAAGNPLTFSFKLFNDATSIGVIQLGATPGTTTASWSAPVTAGAINPISPIGAWCPSTVDADFLSSTPEVGSLCSAGQSLARVNNPSYFALQPLDLYGNQILPDPQKLAAVAASITVTFENNQGSVYDYISSFQLTTTSQATYYIGSFQPGRAGQYNMQASLNSDSAQFVYGQRLFGALPGPTAFATLPVSWPSAMVQDSTVELTFTDSDFNIDPRVTTLAGVVVDTVIPPTKFSLFQSSAANVCSPAPSSSCTVEPGANGGRPFYHCAWNSPVDGQTLTYYLAATDDSTVLTSSSTKVTCATPAADQCPQASCSVHTTLSTTLDGTTSAFVGGFARVDPTNSANDVDAVQIAPTFDNPDGIELNKLLTDNQGIRAGGQIALHLFQYIESEDAYSGQQAMSGLALRLVPSAGSRFKSTLVPSSTLTACPTTNPTGICAGRPGAGYFRVLMTDTVVQALTEDNRFEIWHLVKSKIARTYLYRWRPGPFSPNRSQIIGSGAREIVAGESWSLSFRPFDIYGNQITTQDDFLNWSEPNAIQPVLLSGATPYPSLVPAPPSGPASVPGVASVTKSWSATDGFQMSVTGHYFVVLGIQVYNIGMVSASNNPTATTWPSFFLAGTFQTVVVKANKIYMPNSILAIVPSTEPTIQSQAWLKTVPVAQQAFDLHLIPRDFFQNPTAPQSGSTDPEIRVIVTAGDRYSTPTDAVVSPPQAGWTWVLSSFSTSRATIYTLSGLTIARTSRNGFKIAAVQMPQATGLRTPEQLMFVRSGTSQSSVISLFGSTTPLSTTPYPISIDASFKFSVKITDQNGLPFLYTVGQGATDDNSQVSIALTSEQPSSDGTGTVIRSIAATVVQQTELVAGAPVAIPGQFVIEATNLFFTGLYKMSMKSAYTQTDPILAYDFDVRAGYPFMDYTQFVLQPLATRSEGTFTFKLFDRLQNLIKDDLSPTLGPDGGSTFYPITATNKIYPSIQFGTVNCLDVHDITPNNLQYALPPVVPATSPNFKIRTLFDPASSTYSAKITPAPSGTYTFNVTYIGQSLTVPTSFLSCNSLIPLGFTVQTGPPDATTSYYTIRPVDSRGQTIPWSSAGPNVAAAGSYYQVDLSLVDADGNQSSHTTQTRIFYNPNPSGPQLSKDTALYYNDATDTNLVSLTAQDLTDQMGRGFHRFIFRPKVARNNYIFAVYILEPSLISDQPAVWKRVSGIIPVFGDNQVTTPTPSVTSFTVTHGDPKNLVVDNLAGLVNLSAPASSQVPIVAGSTTSFTVFAVDEYNNPVTSQTSSVLIVTISRDASSFQSDPLVPITGLSWNLPSSALVPASTPGVTTVTYAPSWEGQYSVIVSMVSLDGLTTFASTRAPPSGQTILVAHATCAGQYLAQNGSTDNFVNDKMCSSTGQCVKDFANCTSPQDQTTCPPGQTRIDPTSACVSYTDATYVKCPDGTFAPALNQCAPALVCPAGSKQCPSDQTQCRSSIDDCPATPACPPGLIICPNQLSCARSLNECPSLPDSVVSSCSTVLCPTGSCVLSTADCPTKPSCPLSQVLCLTDGSCQTSADKCPQIPPAQIITPASCAANFQILCPTGDLCAASIADCPSLPTCPVGQVLCAIDNTCKPTSAQCRNPTTDPTLPPPIKPDPTTATCSATEFRCPAGECVQNLALCSSQVTCPAASPVLCADKTCKSSLAVCTVPPSCPSNTVACPATGSCVASYDQCSTPLVCPTSKPVMCANSSCVADIGDCGTPLSCPPALPYTCPSSAVCRASLVDCPTLPHCPATKPLVCDDGSCSISPQMCLSANPGSGSNPPTSSGCPTGLIRCNSGECSSNPLTCPTQVTCTPGTSRCGDGTCRANCDSATTNTCADRNLISCPQSGAGMACAKTLAECPQGFTCPLTKPVRCIDSTCALSTADCPISQDSPPAERVPCPDGSWVIGSSSDCPTAVTCPPSSPIKCYDQTCQKTLDQCPVSTQCDITSATPFRCPSGLCVATLWSCNPVDAQICPPTKPVKCPSPAGGNDCYANLGACPVVGSGTAVDTTIIPDPIEVWTSPCPPGFTQCRDNSCQESPSSCPVFSCPSSFPHICQDGSCATGASHCPSLSGCPWNTPIRCSGIGNCVKSLSECAKPQCDPLFACPDGSCSTLSTDCPAANGCRAGQIRCSDATCVDDASLCISQSNSNYANSCPPGTPFACSNGLCVASSFSCPSMENPSPDAACPAAFPVRCADGICRESTQLCPLIKPCAPETQRCNDGICRNVAANQNVCPNVSNCPIGQIRCKQQDFPSVAILDGMCAEPGQCLAINGCQISNGAALNRCSNNGRCVLDLSLCDTNVRLTNGCLSDTPIKCWNGSCAATALQCPANNNCPSDKPLRCPSGECSSQADGCSTPEQQADCAKTKCADGSCVNKASDCLTSFGCEVTKPVRCADGTCKQLPASYRPFLTNEQANALTCPPVISCPSANYFMCESGSCVLSRESCPSSAYNCNDPAAPFRCLDNTCRPKSDLCGQVEDPANPGSWIPSSGKPASCPSSLPVMCDNGACVSEVYNCDRNTDPATTTITGSPTSSQRDSTKDFQALCEDGTWRDSFADCRQFAEQVNAEVIKDHPELACIDYCPNGRCVLTGQTISSVCAVLSSCPTGQYRCFDGSCSPDLTKCTAVKKSCPATQSLNIDGICRDKANPLQYDGCGPELHENYFCLNRECSSGPSDCLNRETRLIDPFQKDRLAHSDWAVSHGHSQKSQLDHRSVVLAPISLQAVPNSLIAELIADFVDVEHDTTTAADTTPNTPGKSCQGDSCLANQKVYATSLMYSPLAPPQPFPIAPLSTAMTLQLSSGLFADLSRDTNIYIHPVSTSQYYNATNRLTYSRVGQFGKSDTLTAAQTVLSPAFSCSIGDGLTEPFAINIGVSSFIDRSMVPTPQPVDICLARLHRYPQFGYSSWVCLFTEPQRLSGDPQYSIRQSTSQPLRQAVSTISQCYDDILSSSPASGSMEVQDDASTASTKVPAVYAFIHSPVATSQVYLPSKDTFFRNNIIWVLFVIIGGVCLIFFLVYAIMRLSRYTKKTQGIKAEIENTQREVEDMENFGDKRRDVEVGYTANPLAVSLDQQRELEETTNEEKIERKRQIVAAQQADSAERQEIINSLDQENEAALARLQHLRSVAK